MLSPSDMSIFAKMSIFGSESPFPYEDAHQMAFALG